MNSINACFLLYALDSLFQNLDGAVNIILKKIDLSIIYADPLKMHQLIQLSLTTIIYFFFHHRIIIFANLKEKLSKRQLVPSKYIHGVERILSIL